MKKSSYSFEGANTDGRRYLQGLHGEREPEESGNTIAPEEGAAASVTHNVIWRRDEDTCSRDGTASLCSVKSIGVESTGYLSDDEGDDDDDYVHIYNSEYNFSDKGSDDAERSSTRSFRWSSSKQSLTSLLETLSEEVPTIDETPVAKDEEGTGLIRDEMCTKQDEREEDFEILEFSMGRDAAAPDPDDKSRNEAPFDIIRENALSKQNTECQGTGETEKIEDKFNAGSAIKKGGNEEEDLFLYADSNIQGNIKIVDEIVFEMENLTTENIIEYQENDLPVRNLEPDKKEKTIYDLVEEENVNEMFIDKDKTSNGALTEESTELDQMKTNDGLLVVEIIDFQETDLPRSYQGIVKEEKKISEFVEEELIGEQKIKQAERLSNDALLLLTGDKACKDTKEENEEDKFYFEKCGIDVESVVDIEAGDCFSEREQAKGLLNVKENICDEANINDTSEHKLNKKEAEILMNSPENFVKEKEVTSDAFDINSELSETNRDPSFFKTAKKEQSKVVVKPKSQISEEGCLEMDENLFLTEKEDICLSSVELQELHPITVADIDKKSEFDVKVIDERKKMDAQCSTDLANTGFPHQMKRQNVFEELFIESNGSGETDPWMKRSDEESSQQGTIGTKEGSQEFDRLQTLENWSTCSIEKINNDSKDSEVTVATLPFDVAAGKMILTEPIVHQEIDSTRLTKVGYDNAEIEVEERTIKASHTYENGSFDGQEAKDQSSSSMTSKEECIFQDLHDFSVKDNDLNVTNFPSKSNRIERDEESTVLELLPIIATDAFSNKEETGLEIKEYDIPDEDFIRTAKQEVEEQHYEKFKTRHEEFFDIDSELSLTENPRLECLIFNSKIKYSPDQDNAVATESNSFEPTPKLKKSVTENHYNVASSSKLQGNVDFEREHYLTESMHKDDQKTKISEIDEISVEDYIEIMAQLQAETNVKKTADLSAVIYQGKEDALKESMKQSFKINEVETDFAVEDNVMMLSKFQTEPNKDETTKYEAMSNVEKCRAFTSDTSESEVREEEYTMTMNSYQESGKNLDPGAGQPEKEGKQQQVSSQNRESKNFKKVRSSNEKENPIFEIDEKDNEIAVKDSIVMNTSLQKETNLEPYTHASVKLEQISSNEEENQTSKIDKEDNEIAVEDSIIMNSCLQKETNLDPVIKLFEEENKSNQVSSNEVENPAFEIDKKENEIAVEVSNMMNSNVQKETNLDPVLDLSEEKSKANQFSSNEEENPTLKIDKEENEIAVEDYIAKNSSLQNEMNLDQIIDLSEKESNADQFSSNEKENPTFEIDEKENEIAVKDSIVMNISLQKETNLEPDKHVSVKAEQISSNEEENQASEIDEGQNEIAVEDFIVTNSSLKKETNSDPVTCLAEEERKANQVSSNEVENPTYEIDKTENEIAEEDPYVMTSSQQKGPNLDTVTCLAEEERKPNQVLSNEMKNLAFEFEEGENEIAVEDSIVMNSRLQKEANLDPVIEFLAEESKANKVSSKEVEYPAFVIERQENEIVVEDSYAMSSNLQKEMKLDPFTDFSAREIKQKPVLLCEEKNQTSEIDAAENVIAMKHSINLNSRAQKEANIEKKPILSEREIREKEDITNEEKNRYFKENFNGEEKGTPVEDYIKMFSIPREGLAKVYRTRSSDDLKTCNKVLSNKKENLSFTINDVEDEIGVEGYLRKLSNLETLAEPTTGISEECSENKKTLPCEEMNFSPEISGAGNEISVDDYVSSHYKCQLQINDIASSSCLSDASTVTKRQQESRKSKTRKENDGIPVDEYLEMYSESQGNEDPRKNGMLSEDYSKRDIVGEDERRIKKTASFEDHLGKSFSVQETDGLMQGSRQAKTNQIEEDTSTFEEKSDMTVEEFLKMQSLFQANSSLQEMVVQETSKMKEILYTSQDEIVKHKQKHKGPRGKQELCGGNEDLPFHCKLQIETGQNKSKAFKEKSYSKEKDFSLKMKQETDESGSKVLVEKVDAKFDENQITISEDANQQTMIKSVFDIGRNFFARFFPGQTETPKTEEEEGRTDDHIEPKDRLNSNIVSDNESREEMTAHSLENLGKKVTSVSLDQVNDDISGKFMVSEDDEDDKELLTKAAVCETEKVKEENEIMQKQENIAEADDFFLSEERNENTMLAVITKNEVEGKEEADQKFLSLTYDSVKSFFGEKKATKGAELEYNADDREKNDNSNQLSLPSSEKTDYKISDECEEIIERRMMGDGEGAAECTEDCEKTDGKTKANYVPSKIFDNEGSKIHDNHVASTTETDKKVETAITDELLFERIVKDFVPFQERCEIESTDIKMDEGKGKENVVVRNANENHFSESNRDNGRMNDLPRDNDLLPDRSEDAIAKIDTKNNRKAQLDRNDSSEDSQKSDKHLTDEGFTYFDNNAAIIRQSSFKALKDDLKDCALSSLANPGFRTLESLNASEYEKELTVNSDEQHNIFSKDKSNSKADGGNVEPEVNRQLCRDRKTHQICNSALNDFETESHKKLKPIENTDSCKNVKPDLDVTASLTTSEVVFAWPSFGNQTAFFRLPPIKEYDESEFKEERTETNKDISKVSSFDLDITPCNKFQRDTKLQKNVSKVFIIAKSIERNTKKVPLPEAETISKKALREGASMPLEKEVLDTGDVTVKKRNLDAKTKRLYTRQKAFDKYSFQLSTEEQDTKKGKEASTAMNRTDSEKLDEQRLLRDGTEIRHRVLTNEVSTDEPEVGADITVTYGASRSSKVKQRIEENQDSDIIGSYVVLEEREKVSEPDDSEPEVYRGGHDETREKRGKFRKTKSDRRKRSLKYQSKKERQQSEDNDTDVIFDAVTDLDMDAFDTGMDTAFNTDNERDFNSNESFEEITMENTRGNENSGDYDCDFEMLTKPNMSDSQESEYSLAISEDDSITVVMGFDKELNALTVAPPNLVPPKAKSGYSSELEEEAEEEGIRRRRKVHSTSADSSGQNEAKRDKNERQSLKTSNAKEKGDITEPDKIKQQSSDVKNDKETAHILEYEVDWETALDEEKSAVVIVDPETNVIKVGLRKGLIKGSRVREKGKEAKESKEEEIVENNQQLGANGERELIEKMEASVEEMSVVFMEEDGKQGAKQLNETSLQKDEEFKKAEEILHQRRKKQQLEEDVEPKEGLRERRQRREKKEAEEEMDKDFGGTAINKERSNSSLMRDEETIQQEKTNENIRERRQRRERDGKQSQNEDKANKSDSQKNNVSIETETEDMRSQMDDKENSDGKQQEENETLIERRQRRKKKENVADDEVAYIDEGKTQPVTSLKDRRQRREDDRKPIDREQDVNASLKESITEAEEAKQFEEGLSKEEEKQRNVEEETHLKDTLRERRKRQARDEKQEDNRTDQEKGEELRSNVQDAEIQITESLRDRRKQRDVEQETKEYQLGAVEKLKHGGTEVLKNDEEKASEKPGVEKETINSAGKENSDSFGAVQRRRRNRLYSEEEDRINSRAAERVEAAAQSDNAVSQNDLGLRTDDNRINSTIDKENDLQDMKPLNEAKNVDQESKEEIDGKKNVDSMPVRRRGKANEEKKENEVVNEVVEKKTIEAENANESRRNQENSTKRRERKKLDRAISEDSETKSGETETIDKNVSPLNSSGPERESTLRDKGENVGSKEDKIEDKQNIAHTDAEKDENLGNKEEKEEAIDMALIVKEELAPGLLEVFGNVEEKNSSEDNMQIATNKINKELENKEDDNNNNWNANMQAAEGRAAEIYAVAETMLKNNIPLEHTFEKPDWQDHISLRETGYIDDEIIGKSSIHEKITMENAFDERLLKDAEKHAYWDRVLEIRRMRRLSVQRNKEVMAKEKEDLKAGHEVDDKQIGARAGAESSGEIKRRGSRSNSLVENEGRKVDKNLDEKVKDNPSKETAFKEEDDFMVCKTEQGLEEVAGNSMGDESVKLSCKDVSETSPKQGTKEDTGSHRKSKRRGKGKANGNKETEDIKEGITKKVPLIKITHPSTEAFFESQDLDIDEDDEKFIEEVLKQIEQRKLERKKQRELDEQEEKEEEMLLQKRKMYEDDELDGNDVTDANFEAAEERRDDDFSKGVRRKIKHTSGDEVEKERTETKEKYSRIDNLERSTRRRARGVNQDSQENQGVDSSEDFTTSTPRPTQPDQSTNEDRLYRYREKPMIGSPIESKEEPDLSEKRRDFKETISDSLIANYDEDETIDEEIGYLEQTIDSRFGKIFKGDDEDGKDLGMRRQRRSNEDQEDEKIPENVIGSLRERRQRKLNEDDTKDEGSQEEMSGHLGNREANLIELENCKDTDKNEETEKFLEEQPSRQRRRREEAEEKGDVRRKTENEEDKDRRSRGKSEKFYKDDEEMEGRKEKKDEEILERSTRRHRKDGDEEEDTKDFEKRTEQNEDKHTNTRRRGNNERFYKDDKDEVKEKDEDVLERSTRGRRRGRGKEQDVEDVEGKIEPDEEKDRRRRDKNERFYKDNENGVKMKDKKVSEQLTRTGTRERGGGQDAEDVERRIDLDEENNRRRRGRKQQKNERLYKDSEDEEEKKDEEVLERSTRRARWGRGKDQDAENVQRKIEPDEENGTTIRGKDNRFYKDNEGEEEMKDEGVFERSRRRHRQVIDGEERDEYEDAEDRRKNSIKRIKNRDKADITNEELNEETEKKATGTSRSRRGKEKEEIAEDAKRRVEKEGENDSERIEGAFERPARRERRRSTDQNQSANEEIPSRESSSMTIKDDNKKTLEEGRQQKRKSTVDEENQEEQTFTRRRKKADNDDKETEERSRGRDEAEINDVVARRRQRRKSQNEENERNEDFEDTQNAREENDETEEAARSTRRKRNDDGAEKETSSRQVEAKQDDDEGGNYGRRTKRRQRELESKISKTRQEEESKADDFEGSRERNKQRRHSVESMDTEEQKRKETRRRDAKIEKGQRDAEGKSKGTQKGRSRDRRGQESDEEINESNKGKEEGDEDKETSNRSKRLRKAKTDGARYHESEDGKRNSDEEDDGQQRRGRRARNNDEADEKAESGTFRDRRERHEESKNEEYERRRLRDNDDEGDGRKERSTQHIRKYDDSQEQDEVSKKNNRREKNYDNDTKDHKYAQRKKEKGEDEKRAGRRRIHSKNKDDDDDDDGGGDDDDVQNRKYSDHESEARKTKQQDSDDEDISRRRTRRQREKKEEIPNRSRSRRRRQESSESVDSACKNKESGLKDVNVFNKNERASTSSERQENVKDGVDKKGRTEKMHRRSSRNDEGYLEEAAIQSSNDGSMAGKDGRKRKVKKAIKGEPSIEQYDELVGIPRSPSSRNSWKGGDTSRSETERSEAESEAMPTWPVFGGMSADFEQRKEEGDMIGRRRRSSSRNSWKSVDERSEAESIGHRGLFDEDHGMIGRRRRSSARNIWKSGDERSETESIGRLSRNELSDAEEITPQARSRKESDKSLSLKDISDTNPIDRRTNLSKKLDRDTQSHGSSKNVEADTVLSDSRSKAKLNRPSKESIDQMVGMLRSKSTRDEWKKVRET